MSSAIDTRKRQRAHPVPKVEFSRRLQNARNLTHACRHEEALGELNDLASIASNDTQRAKTASLVGASELSLSRYSEAADAYAQASAIAARAGDSKAQLTATIGQVGALLQTSDVATAQSAALATLSGVAAAEQQLLAILNLSPEDLAANGGVILPTRVVRLTVAYTQVARAFLDQGYVDQAKAFLEQACIVAPNGASRARQMLAKIALSADDARTAETYSRDALLMGRFQAKTIAAWPLFFRARAKQGIKPLIDPVIHQAFLGNAQGRVLAASYLSIIESVRGIGDESWKQLANQAVDDGVQDTIILTEIKKLLHADAKLVSTPSGFPRIATVALDLFNDPSVSATEQIAHAKSYVRYSLAAGIPASYISLTDSATAKFGIEHSKNVLHAMALGAQTVGRYDLARQWLVQVRDNVAQVNAVWGRSMYALARVEEAAGNPAAAAEYYLEMAANDHDPARFRVRALLKGFKNLEQTGTVATSTVVQDTIRKILAGASDYRLLLDVARYLQIAGGSFMALRDEAANLGAEFAQQALAQAKTPSDRIAIIEYVARRQYTDLGDATTVIQQWDSFQVVDKQQLAATKASLWYQYLALIFNALVTLGRYPDAVALANSTLGSNATPEGNAILGREYGLCQLRKKDFAGAYQTFEWIVSESPTHRQVASAYYWLALRSLVGNDNTSALASAKALRQCYSGEPATLKEWQLDAAALLILSGTNIDAALVRSCQKYTKDFLTQCQTRMWDDLTKLQ